jgi:hypothetical protein
MLKYGSLNLVSNSNSKTLIPRNLTYNYTNNYTNKSNNIISNDNNISILNIISGTINKLVVNTITTNNNLNINSLNGSIELKINPTTIEIVGPNNLNTSSSINSNTSSSINSNIVNSSFNITNTNNVFNSIAYNPISKIFISSGYSKPNQNIIFILHDIYINQFSGKLNIMSKSLDNNLINIYDVNVWSTFNSTIEYTSIDPININNNGDWTIDTFNLEANNLIINCNGSANNHVLWTIKLDSLTI